MRASPALLRPFSTALFSWAKTRSWLFSSGGYLDPCGGSSLFDELSCFLRMRHVGHMAGIYFDRLGVGALRHHPLLVRIDRSAVATMYQVGLVFHAGFVTLWVNESVEIGTCEIAMNSAFSRGTSAAKSATKCSWSIQKLPLLSCLIAVLAGGTACSIAAQLSPSSSANAAI